jgi:hypothetical protein
LPISPAGIRAGGLSPTSRPFALSLKDGDVPGFDHLGFRQGGIGELVLILDLTTVCRWRGIVQWRMPDGNPERIFPVNTGHFEVAWANRLAHSRDRSTDRHLMSTHAILSVTNWKWFPDPIKESEVKIELNWSADERQ